MAKAVKKPKRTGKGRQLVRTQLTKKKQAELLAMFAVGWAVANACKALNISKQTVYGLRERDPAFALAWDEAKEIGKNELELECRRRATGWTETRIGANGEPYEVYRYSDNLLMFMLKKLDPTYRENMTLNVTEQRHIILELFQVEQDEKTGRLMLLDEDAPRLLTSGEGKS
jgi:hypothetical protein